MNPNIPDATDALNRLAESVAAGGLVPHDELSSLVEKSQGNAQEFTRLLRSHGALTAYQIAALTEGRGASLRIGNYDVLDRLGAGGMGTVFKARHRRMKRLVALKVLATQHSGNPTFVKRFQREVETIAVLGHPNVVMAYDADEAEAGHFLVMEFVDGRDLALCVREEGTFSLFGAVQCILQSARGLAYAHAQGIIHRDVKPHNLMLDAHGMVKVTDLGLARLSREAELRAATDVTMAGGVVGTVDYMSPEQAVDSTTIDHRSDIYSLGGTLHYLLTGEPPFLGPTAMAVMFKHRDAPIPSLRDGRPDAPPQLDDLFRRMLAKQPETRVQQMSEVVAELEPISRKLAPTAAGRAGCSGPFELHTFFGAATSTTLVSDPRAPNPLVSDTRVSDVVLAPQVSEPVSDTRSDPAAEVATWANSVTALVVEPSRVQAAIIKGYLEEHSLDVIGTAVSGKGAIAAVHALRPRVVISAMHLPDLNGVALAEQIRSEVKVDAPGFVLITSQADDGASGELHKLHRVQVLAKPFTADQLVETINQVTGASRPSWAEGTQQKVDRSRLRTLIVDDSSSARMHVRTVLQSLGFSQFLEDPDGAHAIATAARDVCDLIVTDYNMPLMNGLALVSYLKQNPATSAIPIVMVTSETDPRVLDSVRKLGVVAVLEKAFPAPVVGPLLDSLF